MDEFGALVESLGFKSQSSSRSATPLSKLKSKNISPPPRPPPQPTRDPKLSGSGDGIDLDAFFDGTPASSIHHHDHDDIFGLNSSHDLISGLHSTSHPTTIRGNTETKYPGQSGAPPYSGSSFAVDPFSIFEPSASLVQKSSGKNSSPFDELEAFAMGSFQNNGSEPLDVKISDEAITGVQEKLTNLKYLGKKGNADLDSNIKVSQEVRASKITHGSQHFSKTDKVSDRGHSNEAKNTFGNEDSFGSWYSQTSTKSGPKSVIEDPVLDSLSSGRIQNNVELQSSSGTKKAPVITNYVDDFLFFGAPAPSAVEFLESHGEPEERRRARFNQHMRTKERMAKALSEKNQRDLHDRHEQEERHRLAESMDNNLKRWAAGKEGNLRALLSSLHHVLWPESGWQLVFLTDMITSVSVKKVYHRATLCVHPDKVQQKGATVQQKYIAEKIFDILKEAWNKFNVQELR